MRPCKNKKFDEVFEIHVELHGLKLPRDNETLADLGRGKRLSVCASVFQVLRVPKQRTAIVRGNFEDFKFIRAGMTNGHVLN